MRAAIPIVLLLTFAGLCFAQQPTPAEGQVAPAPVAGGPAEAPSAPVIVAPPVPVEVSPDTAIFRRTPVLDGRIEPGEWDVFYSAPAGGITAYADWGSSNLYIAVQADDLAALAISLDLKDDGWYNRDDNYLITISGLAEAQGPTVKAQLYNSGAARGDRLSGMSDVSIVGVVVQASGGSVEVAIPDGAIGGLKLKEKSRFGLRIAVAGKDGVYTPGADPGAVFSCDLASTKSSGPSDLEVELKLSDTKVVAGQRLAAKLSFKSRGKQDISARYFVIGGEGRAAKLLDSEKRMLESGIGPDKRESHTYKTLVTSGIGLGASAIGTELRAADDTRIAAALASFEVVEPYVFVVTSGAVSNDPAKKSKVTLRIGNNTDHVVYGRVAITIPAGWQVSPTIAERQFGIRGEDQATSVPYDLRVAAGTAPGEYEVRFEVKIGKEVFPLAYRVTVAAAAEGKAEGKKPAELP